MIKFILKSIKNELSRLVETTDDRSSLPTTTTNIPSKVSTSFSRFEFLDGYRGSLAILVVIQHAAITYNQIIAAYSQSYSIAGFFMLSAFLLTHRLLNDLAMSNSPKQCFKHISKYFIRRFFRIYLVYLLFYACAKYGPHFIGARQSIKIRYTYKPTIWGIACLANAGFSHLWTIPAEIKYYFIIPIFCSISRTLNRFSPIFLFLCIFWSIWDQMFNFFDLHKDDPGIDNPKTSSLASHFAVFILGSEVALAYHLAEKWELHVWVKKRWLLSVILNIGSLTISLVGLKTNMKRLYDDFAFKSRAAIYWSIVLFLTLVGQPNIVSNFFASSRMLKLCGKWSFSIYLLHPGVVWVISSFEIENEFEHVLVCIVASTLVGALAYVLIENQLIKFANFVCFKFDHWISN